VAVARALISRPAVVFADEPTGALDSVTSRHILDLLRALVDEHQQTVVMVTHDPVAAARADRVVFLADGRIVEDLQGPLTAEEIAARTASLESGRTASFESGRTARLEPGRTASPGSERVAGAARPAPGPAAGISRPTHGRATGITDRPSGRRPQIEAEPC
jgi:ABC-type glutathione transport system ATPase component